MLGIFYEVDGYVLVEVEEGEGLDWVTGVDDSKGEVLEAVDELGEADDILILEEVLRGELS